jgi:hypothetical protein
LWGNPRSSGAHSNLPDAGPAFLPNRPAAIMVRLLGRGASQHEARGGPLESTPAVTPISWRPSGTPAGAPEQGHARPGFPIYAKLEYFNPGGSGDRIAGGCWSYERSGVPRPGASWWRHRQHRRGPALAQPPVPGHLRDARQDEPGKSSSCGLRRRVVLAPLPSCRVRAPVLGRRSDRVETPNAVLAVISQPRQSGEHYCPPPPDLGADSRRVTHIVVGMGTGTIRARPYMREHGRCSHCRVDQWGRCWEAWRREAVRMACRPGYKVEVLRGLLPSTLISAWWMRHQVDDAEAFR